MTALMSVANGERASASYPVAETRDPASDWVMVLARKCILNKDDPHAIDAALNALEGLLHSRPPEETGQLFKEAVADAMGVLRVVLPELADTAGTSNRERIEKLAREQVNVGERTRVASNVQETHVGARMNELSEIPDENADGSESREGVSAHAASSMSSVAPRNDDSSRSDLLSSPRSAQMVPGARRRYGASYARSVASAPSVVQGRQLRKAASDARLAGPMQIPDSERMANLMRIAETRDPATTWVAVLSRKCVQSNDPDDVEAALSGLEKLLDSRPLGNELSATPYVKSVASAFHSLLEAMPALADADEHAALASNRNRLMNLVLDHKDALEGFGISLDTAVAQAFDRNQERIREWTDGLPEIDDEEDIGAPAGERSRASMGATSVSGSTNRSSEASYGLDRGLGLLGTSGMHDAVPQLDDDMLESASERSSSLSQALQIPLPASPQNTLPVQSLEVRISRNGLTNKSSAQLRRHLLSNPYRWEGAGVPAASAAWRQDASVADESDSESVTDSEREAYAYLQRGVMDPVAFPRAPLSHITERSEGSIASAASTTEERYADYAPTKPPSFLASTVDGASDIGERSDAGSWGQHRYAVNEPRGGYPESTRSDEYPESVRSDEYPESVRSGDLPTESLGARRSWRPEMGASPDDAWNVDPSLRYQPGQFVFAAPIGETTESSGETPHVPATRQGTQETDATMMTSSTAVTSWREMFDRRPEEDSPATSEDGDGDASPGSPLPEETGLRTSDEDGESKTTPSPRGRRNSM